MREEAETYRNLLAHLTALIAELEASADPGEVFDTLLCLRDDVRDEQARRSKQIVKPELRTIVETPVATMADTRTMSELLQAPTEENLDWMVSMHCKMCRFDAILKKCGVGTYGGDLKMIPRLTKRFIKPLLKIRDVILEIRGLRRRKEIIQKLRNEIFLYMDRMSEFFFKPNPGCPLKRKQEKHQLDIFMWNILVLKRRSDLVKPKK
nr:hypothetical protein [Tanacetum cinerariifolium]